MKKILTFSESAFFAFALLFGATFVLQSHTVQAADEETSELATTENQEQQSNSDDQGYNYVAQPSDTYSQMARKAIQTYGIVNKVDLSQAQIIAAETNLTLKAGSPYLIIGQKVEINKEDVKNQVDAAKKLTDSQQAAWAMYAVGVNFNTDAVGQPQSN